MTLRPETNVRLTDIIGDRVLPRLGNTGMELLTDLLQKFNDAIGSPFEVTPSSTPSSQLFISSGVYTLPDGRRVAGLKNGMLPSFTNGTIDFAAGTISAGSAPTFVVPTMTAGNYIRALIQYNYYTNALTVNFGGQSTLLSATSIPPVLTDFDPLELVELHSTSGGQTFDPIDKPNLIAIKDSQDFEFDPQEEVQTVTSSPQTTFTLTTIVIPSARKRLLVFINGLKQVLNSHYTIVNNTTVQFTSSLPVNAQVAFVVV